MYVLWTTLTQNPSYAPETDPKLSCVKSSPVEIDGDDLMTWTNASVKEEIGARAPWRSK